ncbi:hypothetical protein BKA59DRAFT_368831, partial [Fusarium tricinctum]
FGVSYEDCDEEPCTIAVLKHTMNEIPKTNSFYVRKLFDQNLGSKTAPISATGGDVGPVYWSATKTTCESFLKLVNYNSESGSDKAVKVTVKDSKATIATLTVLPAPSSSSVNNFSSGGGETRSITTILPKAENGVFSMAFSKSYKIVILKI